ncbi:MAG: tryptophan--tRNA ligase, partial [Acidobacteria bacterium]|nr:tryptophan--tRNA ligase [Acidobacteriota bacterium]
DFAAARGYGDLKGTVAETLVEIVTPIRQRYEELMSAPDELDRLLAIGAERARAVAEPKAAEIRRLVGFA